MRETRAATTHVRACCSEHGLHGSGPPRRRSRSPRRVHSRPRRSSRVAPTLGTRTSRRSSAGSSPSRARNRLALKRVWKLLGLLLAVLAAAVELSREVLDEQLHLDVALL